MKKNNQPWVRTSVKALIVKDGKILLIKERFEDKIIYDFPGGGLKYGESLSETLEREVFEEVGLKVKQGELIGAWDFILEKWQVEIVCIGYQCEILGEEKIDLSKNPAEEDIFEYLWLSQAEILAEPHQYIKRPGMLAAVKNLRF